MNPETFDCVTIYFSDIVGFTTICSKSNPFEVVAMLNGLYSRFDEVILNVDAYKVQLLYFRNREQVVKNVCFRLKQ